MLDEIPPEDQYVFTSLRYDGNSMKPGITKRHSSMNGNMNPVCRDCPDAGKSAYLMKYHYERLVTAADHLGWYDTAKILKGPVELFNRVEKAVCEHKKQTGNKCPFKVCCLISFFPSFYPGLSSVPLSLMRQRLNISVSFSAPCKIVKKYQDCCLRHNNSVVSHPINFLYVVHQSTAVFEDLSHA